MDAILSRLKMKGKSDRRQSTENLNVFLSFKVKDTVLEGGE